MLMEAETWVALAFVLFVGLLGYLGVHRTVSYTHLTLPTICSV